MRVKILFESGYLNALLGLGLSYGITSDCEFRDISLEKFSKLENIGMKLAFKDGGENKFLRQISMMLDITAPLYWWKQFDTYKVGTTAQSESTMHSIMNREFGFDQFEEFRDSATRDVLRIVIGRLNELRRIYLGSETSETNFVKKELWRHIIMLLPESWLQRRIVSLNYAVLQNIIAKRWNHKLQEWRYFCETILKNCRRPEFIATKEILDA